MSLPHRPVAVAVGTLQGEKQSKHGDCGSRSGHSLRVPQVCANHGVLRCMPCIFKFCSPAGRAHLPPRTQECVPGAGWWH